MSDDIYSFKTVQCDRCDCSISANIAVELELSEHEYYDTLCPDCYKELNKKGKIEGGGNK